MALSDQSASVASKRMVTANDTVIWSKQREGIVTNGISHRTHCRRHINTPCHRHGRSEYLYLLVSDKWY